MYPTLGKKKATLIRQLALKKHRLEQAAFVLEGKKSIQALLNSGYTMKCIVATPSFLLENQDMLYAIHGDTEVFSADKTRLSRLGAFVHNHEVLAVAALPSPTEPCLSPTGITLALDGIQDPGNLGTIIRIADWYGIATILCSKTTVELYNPKVLQASMGSFIQVKLYYVDLVDYLQGLTLPILGATLDGRPVHDIVFPKDGILVIGNESHGIHPTVQQTLTESVAIPRYGSANSLNAAIATGILCDNWRRVVSG